MKVLETLLALLPVVTLSVGALGQERDTRALSRPESAQSAADFEKLEDRIAKQESELKKLRSMLEEQVQTKHFGLQAAGDTGGCDKEMIERVPLVAELPVEETCESSASDTPFRTVNFFSDYDRGFVIKPFDREKHPFELKLNGWTQFRYHGFDRDISSWTDNAGVTRSVSSRSAFDIERGRFVFSGFAFDPRLTYFLQLDGDTDGQHVVDFFDYFWGWKVTDEFQIQFGKRKVTASRQWLLSARFTRFADRPMANDFFRPDRTVGLFGVGSFGDKVHYELMIGNSFISPNLSNSDVDNRLTYSATTYIDPLGDYGGPLVDYENTSNARLRIGHSFVFSPQSGQSNGAAFPESDFVRLSDGTRLTQPGALAPLTTVNDFDIYLYCIDAAFKHRGWSANSEVFVRWIEDMNASVALPRSDLFQHGFYIEGGRFLIPHKLDLNVRYSQVSGEFGTGSEMAVGGNYYPLRRSNLKLSVDVTSLDGSPLQNTTSDILVGDDGTLLRAQFQAEF